MPYQNVVANDKSHWHNTGLAIFQCDNAKKPTNGECWLEKQRKFDGTFEFGKILCIATALQ